MNLAELTDLELAELVLNKTEAAIQTDSFTKKAWIAASAQIDLESFFHELRQAWLWNGTKPGVCSLCREAFR